MNKKKEYFFPMHKAYTKKAKHVANSKSFELLIDFTVMANIIVLAMAGHNQAKWIEHTSEVSKYVFVLIYTFEIGVKWAAAGIRPYFRTKLNRLDFVIVATTYLGLFAGDLSQSREFFAIQLLRVLRIAKLVFRLKYLRDLLELAFSSSKALMSLVTFLMFVITLFGIIGMHLFASSCHGEDDTAPPSSFGSFSGSVLALFQIITNDNLGGILYYYMDCYDGYAVVGTYFIVVYIFCNYVIVNLFMAVFIENFELSEEIKAARQEEMFKARMSENRAFSIDAPAGEMEPTKLLQLKTLQLSLFLDKNSKKHVFQRMSKFSTAVETTLRGQSSNMADAANEAISQLAEVDPELVTVRVQLLVVAISAATTKERAARNKHVELREELAKIDEQAGQSQSVLTADSLRSSLSDKLSTDGEQAAVSLATLKETRAELAALDQLAADEHAEAEDELITAQRLFVGAAAEIEDITGEQARPYETAAVNTQGLTCGVDCGRATVSCPWWTERRLHCQQGAR